MGGGVKKSETMTASVLNKQSFLFLILLVCHVSVAEKLPVIWFDKPSLTYWAAPASIHV